MSSTNILEPWQIALIVLASILVCLFLLYRVALLLAVRSYRAMVRDNAVSVDEFVNRGSKKGVEPSPSSCLKCVLLNRFNVGGRRAGMEGLDLVTIESDHVPGLKVTKRKGAAGSNVGKAEDVGTSRKADELPPLVVGTIRMGFGHHRIAYAATSWGLAAAEGGDDDGDGRRQTYFHDLLNIESAEATMIHETDKMYSKGSRIASEMGGVVEKFWGSLTKSGDEDSLRVTYQMAEHLRPIIGGLDRDSPIVASHSLVAAAAVAAGFNNVINLVIDNHAQWFVVVPGALNLVQGPTNYAQFLKWGVPPSQLGLAGHWIPRDLVEGVPDACARRIARVNSSDPRKPLRLLIPVGGAGAQRKFVCAFLEALAPLVKGGRVQLFLNAGDHAHMKEAFMEVLDGNKLDYDIVPDIAGVRAFKDNLLKDANGRSEPRKAVTLFAFDEYFTAVATTDILCNVADVLAVKPSELAFYPIPKLMIRRVGDHEEYSAIRASELGDGTLEARTVDDAMEYVRTFLEGPELLTEMNRAIEKNASIGIYDGCKNAIRIALERAEEARKASKEKGQ